MSPCPNLPLSPCPNDQIVSPSIDRANVCDVPHDTCCTAPILDTLVGTIHVVVVPCPIIIIYSISYIRYSISYISWYVYQYTVLATLVYQYTVLATLDTVLATLVGIQY